MCIRDRVNLNDTLYLIFLKFDLIIVVLYFKKITLGVCR